MIVRILGIILASIAIGFLVSTTRRYNPPGRYWGVAASVTFDLTLLYYRVRLITLHSPVNIGDIGFILANVFLLVGGTKFLRTPQDVNEGE